MRLTKLFQQFYTSERLGSFLLIACTFISISLANSTIGNSYLQFWHQSVYGHSVIHWVNDGLMTIFFLLIGLELEREIYLGELSNLRSALLPITAAVGGMLVPAFIYFIFNHNSPTQSGLGIPISTDIAFSAGVLSLIGKRIPASLKIFILALAIIDDLGAIVVIAVFYAQTLSLTNLGIALAIFAALLLLNRLKINNLLPYIIGGIVMWYFMLHSGIHPSISGVLLATAIPFRSGGKKSPSYILQRYLNIPVALIILPLFALANTCFVLNDNWSSALFSNESLGIFIGLSMGKPVGIVLFSSIMIATGICSLPESLKLKHIVGGGILCGIGFTMSIFITNLAFSNSSDIECSKIAILIASLLSGVAGYLWLKVATYSK